MKQYRFAVTVSFGADCALEALGRVYAAMTQVTYCDRPTIEQWRCTPCADVRSRAARQSGCRAGVDLCAARTLSRCGVPCGPRGSLGRSLTGVEALFRAVMSPARWGRIPLPHLSSGADQMD